MRFMFVTRWFNYFLSVLKKTQLFFLKLVFYIPLILVIVTFVIFVDHIINENYYASQYTDLREKELSKSQELAINLVMELNKYIISIGTGLFGLTGYYLNNYTSHISIKAIKISFLLSLFLLALAGLYAFDVYTELANSLSQETYPLTYGKNKVFFLVEAEFILCIGSSISLGSIFAVLQFNNTPQI